MITIEELRAFRKKLIESMEEENCAEYYAYHLDAVQHLHALEMSIRNTVTPLLEFTPSNFQNILGDLSPGLFENFKVTPEIEQAAKLISELGNKLPAGLRDSYYNGLNIGLQMLPESLRDKVAALFRGQMTGSISGAVESPSWVADELEKLKKGNADLAEITSRLVKEEGDGDDPTGSEPK